VEGAKQAAVDITWHMPSNAVSQPTHVTVPVLQTTDAMQASTDSHAVVALEDVMCTTCGRWPSKLGITHQCWHNHIDTHGKQLNRVCKNMR